MSTANQHPNPWRPTGYTVGSVPTVSITAPTGVVVTVSRRKDERARVSVTVAKSQGVYVNGKPVA